MPEITAARTLQAVLRADLLAFLERSFRDLDPRAALTIAPYVEHLVSALLDVFEGHERRLIINLPPRHLKSILVSIVFPAWLLGRDPRKRIAVISHGQSLARDLAVKTHRLVTADWYREVFPAVRLSADRSGVMDFETTHGGGRYAASLDTGITGRGFDVIIVDDPLSAQDARSAAERERVQNAFDGMISSRLDDPARGAIIVVHQRLHEDDLTGHLLRGGGWRQVSLPLIADERTDHWIGDRKWTREIDDVLLPQVFTAEAIEQLRRQHGEGHFATQYQQNPTAASGELIKLAYIVYFDELPQAAKRITLSVDTAVKVTEDASFSVIMVITSDGYRHYVIDVLRRRLDIVQMRKAMISTIQQYGPTTILIEDASSGPGLARMLEELGCRTVLWPTGGRSKQDRLETHLGTFAEGRVLVRAEQPWTVPLVREWAAFPNARHDDQVDTITQYLDWWATHHLVRPVVMGAGGRMVRAETMLFAPPRKGENPLRPRGSARGRVTWRPR